MRILPAAQAAAIEPRPACGSPSPSNAWRAARRGLHPGPGLRAAPHRHRRHPRRRERRRAAAGRPGSPPTGRGDRRRRPNPARATPGARTAGRLARLCAFANETSDATWMQPVLRSLAVHFMVGYDHYFEGGNGRTARALFYRSMLKRGYWLTEFLTISRILNKAPAQYARSYL